MGVSTVAPIVRAGESDDVRVPLAEREQGLTNHPPHSVLSPMLIGPATLLGSSAGLRWRGILLEKHSCRPGERPEGNSVDVPVLVMVCSPAWQGELKAIDGTFVSKSTRLGALAVKPRGPVPAMRSRQKVDVLYCGFDESFLSAVRNELERPFLLPLEARSGLYDPAISEILKLLFAEVESGGATGTLYVDSLTHALAVRFLFLGERQPMRPRRATTLPQRKLFRVQELIESQLEADLTLQELAAEAGYSRSHFLRMFHATTGMPPHRYVLKRRIERARRLLEHTDVSIAEVAYSCGFSSQAHLTLAFRKECGLTPAKYRRQL